MLRIASKIDHSNPYLDAVATKRTFPRETLKKASQALTGKKLEKYKDGWMSAIAIERSER